MGTWDYDPESGLISWDERSCALFGLDSADLRSLSVTETLSHVHPEDRSRVEADLTTPVLKIEEGARFEGSCKMGDEAKSNVVDLPATPRRP